MVLGTAVTGILIGILGVVIGAWLVGGNAFGGFGDVVGALIGMVFGYPVGVIIGMVLIRYVLHYRGSVIFGTGGVVVAMGLFLLLTGMGLYFEPVFLWTMLFALCPILGTAGYYLGRRVS